MFGHCSKRGYNLITFCRNRIGLSEDDIVSVKSVVSKQQKQQKALQDLQKANIKLEDEKIALRLKNQQLNKLMLQEASETTDVKAVDEIDGVDKQKHQDIVEENEAMRKGLHEILDKLHAKEGNILNIHSLICES